ncbi:sulfotransferase [Haloflavibacter putidus]|uniref:Sulfotransferase family protein n=1 Tax=Haloflavibacter putidus TaxID=2576776 RepID=A0A507ZA14_9FLAO|nr:sulfotransferase [Haloflavibacter putidus]TQD33807.1 hypothetical protein FKR84_12675 [Haloflavibacter putidus]
MIDYLKQILSREDRKRLHRKKWAIFHGNEPKVFGIGLNKTGTTSLTKAMSGLGYRVGDQYNALKDFESYQKRDFKPIIKYCKTAQFFQDIPFSLPFTYVILDHYFPNSKFILTIRDNPEQWYESLTSFHAKLWGKNNKTPVKKNLISAKYIRKGLPWDLIQEFFDTRDNDPYEKETLINHYLNHNKQVKHYFQNRTEDLLVLNVSKKGAYRELCRFLNKPVNAEEFPWENKT